MFEAGTDVAVEHERVRAVTRATAVDDEIDYDRAVAGRCWHALSGAPEAHSWVPSASCTARRHRGRGERASISTIFSFVSVLVDTLNELNTNFLENTIN
jgi:hypothetical protein